MPSRLICCAVLSCLSWASAAAQEFRIHTFEEIPLSAEFFSEGASFGDLDRDGHMDIVSGPYWYAGPGFSARHEIYAPRPFDTKGYSDNFFAWVRDFDGDGWNDVLVVGFPGQDASWFVNPRGAEGHWKRHVVFDVVDNESPDFVDLTGDGLPELVCQHDDRVGWAEPDWEAPERPWTWHPLSGAGIGGRFTHGLGVGDVNGDGRPDVLGRAGWWEQPATLTGDPAWTHHPHAFAGRGGAQMFAFDVDGDGDNDVITADNAHGYGLYWFESVPDGEGLAFRKHRIMGNEPGHSPFGTVIGNLHAMALVDMDDDGLPDLVTGNRFWAHGGGDKADHEPPPVAWFRLERGASGEGLVRFVPHVIDGDSGVGTQVVAGDVNGDGLVDVVVGNKAGTFVHIHRVRQATREEWQAAQPRPVEGYVDDGAGMYEAAAGADQGVSPVGLDGRPLNLDFESGDLRDWTKSGDAFEGQPVRGDTVQPRRSDSKSGHAGDYWIGTYEPERSDRSRGTLTSAPFRLTHAYATFLIGGGRGKEMRFELVLAEGEEVIHRTSGSNQEEMAPDVIDLRPHQGAVAFIRLVDDSAGGWGHINFDHFRFHGEKPSVEPRPVRVDPADQKTGNAPEEAARKMTVPDGFRVDLVVGEPDLHQPIALALDEKGRVWVAEAYSYPIRRADADALDKIVVFEDTDGDGLHDKRTVFADNLNLVSGLEVGFGGVWVGAAPYFMFIPDRDGDLVPDGPPEILLDGWGFQDTHETLNAFNWGPDGWLYGCHGVFTHSLVGRPGTPDEERTPLNAGVWRYHPTKHRFEVFAWGASNQWGVDFDDYGQAFITACVIPHLYHVAQGGRYQRQAGRHFNPYVFDDIKTIADHRHYLGTTPHSGNGISNSVGGGHAHCGAMIYLGDSFPDEYRNRILFSNIHGNRINVDLLERSGSGFIGRHGDDFLVANDLWFRGINLRYGPDGSVFLIDWYDRQACHLKDPQIWDRTNGRLYRISYGDAPPVTVDLSALGDTELVNLHLHANDWYVRQARKLIQERGLQADVLRRLLAIVATHPDVTRKLRALWTIGAAGGMDEALGLRLLSRPEEHVRAWTIQLLLEDGQASATLVRRLTELASRDTSPIIRLYLAAALQRLPVEDRWEIARALVARAEDARDQNIPLIVWYGIEPLVATDPERALALAEASRLPLVTRYIHRRMASGKNPALGPLCEALERADGQDSRLAILDEILIALRTRDAVEMPARWPGLARTLLATGSEPVVDRTVALSVVFGDRSALPRLRQTAQDRNAPDVRRKDALRSLMRVKDPDLVGLLQGLLDDRAVRLDAIRHLASFDDDRTPLLLLGRYDDFDEEERAAIATTLSSRPGFARILLQAVIDERVPKTVLASATTRRLITGLADEEVDHLMEGAWGRARPLGEDKLARIAEFRAKLTPETLAQADLFRGRAVFAKTCMKCHTLFGVGQDIGPDLTGSNRADQDYILRNILDPSAEVAKEYMNTMLMIEDGRLLDAIVTDENDETLTLRTADETFVIAKSAIDLDREGLPERWMTESSMMPEDQLDPMSASDIRDLIAYVASPVQVPMEVDDTNVLLFFSGEDLAFWDADPEIWSVEQGEIVGRTATGLKTNSFLSSHLLLKDFRLTLQVRLLPDTANSGIQVRSQRVEGGMRGWQADIGQGWWGKLYEEHGRGLLWDRPADAPVRPGAWNTYEILVTGTRIRTAINGRPCVDLDDPAGAAAGQIAFQVHSGGPTEVRFRELKLELDPEPRLTTVGQ